MKVLGNNVLVKIQMSNKENYSLMEGVDIFIEKGYNFNRREDSPSFGKVVHGGNIPEGAEVLLHHNSTEPAYAVYYDVLTEEEKKDGYKLFCIDKDMVFCYRKEKEWIPCENYLISRRIFKPYKGKLAGIPDEQVKNRLYIVKGKVEDAPDLEGKVCLVTANSDYEIIWHNGNHREERMIRTRSREIEGIDETMTKDLKKGKYYLK